MLEGEERLVDSRPGSVVRTGPGWRRGEVMTKRESWEEIKGDGGELKDTSQNYQNSRFNWKVLVTGICERGGNSGYRDR